LALGCKAVVPQMPLFKVFPPFGALILGQPLEQRWVPESRLRVL